MSALLIGSACFALGVVSSETVRRLWNRYVAPEIAKLEADAKL